MKGRTGARMASSVQKKTSLQKKKILKRKQVLLQQKAHASGKVVAVRDHDCDPGGIARSARRRNRGKGYAHDYLKSFGIGLVLTDTSKRVEVKRQLQQKALEQAAQDAIRMARRKRRSHVNARAGQAVEPPLPPPRPASSAHTPAAATNAQDAPLLDAENAAKPSPTVVAAAAADRPAGRGIFHGLLERFRRKAQPLDPPDPPHPVDSKTKQEADLRLCAGAKVDAAVEAAGEAVRGKSEIVVAAKDGCLTSAQARAANIARKGGYAFAADVYGALPRRSTSYTADNKGFVIAPRVKSRAWPLTKAGKWGKVLSLRLRRAKASEEGTTGAPHDADDAEENSSSPCSPRVRRAAAAASTRTAGGKMAAGAGCYPAAGERRRSAPRDPRDPRLIQMGAMSPGGTLQVKLRRQKERWARGGRGSPLASMRQRAALSGTGRKDGKPSRRSKRSSRMRIPAGISHEKVRRFKGSPAK
jgi:hypothetical protein